jgi:Ti-type conjugative transfer relaxase TraA
MAIYHFSAKVISRAAGSSAVAAAAYRSASRLHDERLDRPHDFTNKAGVIHSEVMTPEGAPERWQDRETLWNEVEAGEKRKDAQLAREIEFAIPREMNQAQGVELATDFVRREFVDRGMVADLNVHWDFGEDGLPKPHAHVMLAMRAVGSDGFGPKVRDWNRTEQLEHWREAWASHVNRRLAELDIDARVDHRSLEAQGVALEPQHKIGAAGARREARSEAAERADEHREIARRNGERIIADPKVALDAITHQQSTFTERDLARFIHRHTDDAEQYARALSAVKNAPELVALGVDGRGRPRFSTRDMIKTEQRLERAAERLAERRGHQVSPAARGGQPAAGEGRAIILGGEQRDALTHVVGAGDLAMVVGYAGTGKSAMLGVAREAWEAAGYQVRGAALSGIAAESLEGGSGIASRTLASLEHGWGQGRGLLEANDVLVIDEAGMVGSRQMERVLSAAQEAGAKVVLVGDPEQLQAIEAGAAFRALTERHGAAEITEVRRQRSDWQRAATRELATGRTAEALGRYEAVGAVQGHATREKARDALVAGWDSLRQAQPEANQVMLAHTRVDVAALNQLARTRMRAGGQLGDDRVLQTERGERAFAVGDRLMFLRNERSMGVKNGTLGTVEQVDHGGMVVRLDGSGAAVAFDLKDYPQIDHGYASTVHKAQGVTVDHAHLLASDGLDRHAAYVGMSRHRESLAVHYGADDFKDRTELGRTLGRERAKDTTLEYSAAFAERRGLIKVGADVVRDAVARTAQSRFAGFRPKPASLDHRTSEPGLEPEVRQFARTWAEIEQAEARGVAVLPHQIEALRRSDTVLRRKNRDRAQDVRQALWRKPGLAQQAESPQGRKALSKAIETEAKIRVDPQLRADRFVDDWKRFVRQSPETGDWRDPTRQAKIEQRMRSLVQAVERDPKVETLLAARRKDLGVPPSGRSGERIGQALVRALGMGRDQGMDR